jgi:hypothetical protein
LGEAGVVRSFYGVSMSTRVPVIVTGVVLLAFLVYVGVSSSNGSYLRASEIGAADVSALRDGNAVVGKIRLVPGVRSANFAFTSGLFADRKSALSVTMKSTAALTQVQRVTALVRDTYGHGEGANDGADLELSMPDAPALSVTDFSMSARRLDHDLTAWDSLRRATGTAVAVQLSSADHRNLEFVSRHGATFAWVASHYSLLKSLSAQGFTWTSPGVCSVGSLPDEAVIEVIARLSQIVPTTTCNSSESESPLAVAPGGSNAVMPFVVLGFGTSTSRQPFSAHARQFARVSAVLLSPSSPDVNVGFFEVSKGKLTVLRFFTGTCTSGVVTHSDPVDGRSLAILKSRGIDVVRRATLGQCSPKTPVPSASPTPDG